MKNSNYIKMYFKIFLIIFIVGIIFPYAINFLIEKLALNRGNAPSGNSVFVMYSMDDKLSILDYIRGIIN